MDGVMLIRCCRGVGGLETGGCVKTESFDGVYGDGKGLVRVNGVA